MSRIYFGSINLTKKKIKDEFQNKKLIFVDNASEISGNYSIFFDSDKIFLHVNPNIENLKIISSDIERKRGVHFLYYEDESFDGRNSLIQSIKKSGQIYDVSNPIYGDVNSLKRHINNLSKEYNVKFLPEALDWLVQNPPILRMRLKTANSKKEILQYDLDLLSQEIHKISSYTDTIREEDFSNCLFKSETDIFDFIEAVLDKDISKVLSKLDEMVEAVTDQGLLLILLLQLHFLLVCLSCKEDKIYNYETVLSVLEMEDILGKYLSSDYQKVSFQKKTQNPIRVKIELGKKRTQSSKDIVKMIGLVVDTIVELRDNGNKLLALPILFHKLVTV